jgi:Uma2 family endonuclease
MAVKREIDIESLPLYTIEDWKGWEGNWELIDGIPYAMSPMPSKQHQRVNIKLINQFSALLESCPDCETFLPLNYRINDFTILHPDMVIVCDEPAKGLYLENKPSLVAEVISPSTVKVDRNRKLKLYAAAEIKYYLIADPDKEFIEVWELQGENYKLIGKFHEGSFTFDFDKCKIPFDFAHLW